MAWARCICGAALGRPNGHGIRLCPLCGGTTDADGTYAPDPRAPRVRTMVYDYKPAPPPPDLAALGEAAIERLARLYLDAARDLQPVLCPGEGAVPTYDQIPEGHRQLLQAALARSLATWIEEMRT